MTDNDSRISMNPEVSDGIVTSSMDAADGMEGAATDGIAAGGMGLDSQLCFPLQAAARELVRQYRPYLDPLGLTYTQYTVMQALWEQPRRTVNELGARLKLDTASLTPVLKGLEARDLLCRSHAEEGGRTVLAELMPEGEALAERARGIPEAVRGGLRLSTEEIEALRGLLFRLLDSLAE